MNSADTALSKLDLHKIQQIVKWSVYALLLINFAYYFYEDWTIAAHTLDLESSFLKWTSGFATSIDESAWFLLLLMFELETYFLEDRSGTDWTTRAVHAVRILCFIMIAHTVYAFAQTVIDLRPTVAVENVSSLCDMTDSEVSYVYNLEYTDVTTENCSQLSTSTQFYWLAEDPVVSDIDGLELERDLALVDLLEAVVWLFIIIAIEAIVRLQDRGIAGGTLLSGINLFKYVLYAILIAFGVYWATLSHWLYLWDELLWIGGFAAIEMNVSQWRDELIDEQALIPAESGVDA